MYGYNTPYGTAEYTRIAPDYGVMTPARAARSASTLAQLGYSVAPGNAVVSLAEIVLPTWVQKPPSSTGDAYLQVAYWLAIGVQLARGREQTWSTLAKEAWDAYRQGNLTGVGLDRDDRREDVLRWGVEIAVRNNIPESASALVQLANAVRDRKKGKGLLVGVLAILGIGIAAYAFTR